MPNDNPLEKQLFHIDLRKGVNERERPETADPAMLITRLENLYQDQTGAWVKRPGLAMLGGGIVDDDGTTLLPVRLLRLVKGLAMASTTGKLLHYQENRGKFVERGSLPSYTVEGADTIVSSAGSGYPTLNEVASCTDFHAIIANSSDGYSVSIYEKASGSVVARYALSSFSAISWRMVFVGDRYLHVFFTKNGLGLFGFVIDTQAALPLLSAITPTNLMADVGLSVLYDVSRHTDRSFVVYSGTTDNIVAMDNSAAVVDNVAFAGTRSISNSGTMLWRLDGTNLEALSPTDLTTVLVAAGAHGIALNDFHLVAKPDNTVYVLDQLLTTAFGTGTIPSIFVYATIIANTTALLTLATVNGWKMVSAPFIGFGDRVHLHVMKYKSVTTDVVPHVIIDVNNLNGFGAITKSGQTYYSANIACELEPFIAIPHNTDKLRYFSYNNDTISPGLSIQPSGRNYGYTVFNIRPANYTKVVARTFGGASYISGGRHMAYSGDRLYESGLTDYPIVNSAAGAAGGLTGAVKYIAVYKHVDTSGAVTFSRTSEVSSITLANTDTDLTVSPPSVTNNDLRSSDRGWFSAQPPTVGVELYRTQVGGTQYYLCAASMTPTSLATQTMVLAATGFYTVTDTLTDATLATQPLLHRQPGTPGSAVDRYPPPASNILTPHKDRLFATDPYGVRVYYSSFFVDGETAWYNPGFSFFVHGGTGPITGLVSMDGRLFVFKRDSVFVVDGDGPGEGGVVGNEYSPPHRLATPFGCIDHRSLVVTSEGILYRSPRGIELLTRSLQVKPVGDRVQNTLASNPYTQAATIDASGLVHFLVTATEPTTNLVTGTGAELVYDTTQDAWSVFLNHTHSGVYSTAVQDCELVDLDGLGEVMVYADLESGVRVASASTWIDADAYFVPWVIETGWVRSGQQARQRISKALFLAKKQTNHAIKIEAAFNFSGTYTQSKTFEPGVINAADIEELELSCSKQQTLATRFRISEQAPADTTTYPITTGRGCEVLGISAEIAVKQGAPDVSSDRKG